MLLLLEINYTVYFLKAYAKNEQIDLSPTDKKRLSALVIAIKAS